MSEHQVDMTIEVRVTVEADSPGDARTVAEEHVRGVLEDGSELALEDVRVQARSGAESEAYWRAERAAQDEQ